MDETRSNDILPNIPAPPGVTRNTGAVSTGLTDTANREYPEIPGYEVLGILGYGGMGVVYRARQLKANRLVALKMIRAVEHATPQDRLRFQIETEAVARLQHPNIVHLYEVGEVHGQPFFSLEFCGGGGLDKHLKTWRPAPNEAAEMIETLARAMHYAHLRGVVHRDLKPANILLAGCGLAEGDKPQAANSVPKITDFGLAKRLDAEARDVSRTGTVMGTPEYMAPEQAEGKVRDTGPAADVYSLGALLYVCLTGRPPFVGDTTLDTLRQVLNDEPLPPSRLVPKVPRDLETICLKCLAKEPGRRYASAEALAEDLLRYQMGELIAARLAGRMERVAKWVKRRPALAALLGVTVLAIVTLSVFSVYLVKLAATAENERKEAVKQADKAKKAQEFLASIFDLSDANGLRGTMTARQILDDAEKRIPLEFADQPELQEELMAAIETVYAKMTVNAPLAMILEVRGTVQLHSSRDANQRALPQTLLYAGDRLILAADAQVQLVYLSDLHKERLKPAQEATVRRKGSEPGDAVSERTNDVMMTFVKLQKATFYKGWDGEKKGKKTEIKEDFYIAVHAVTQGQWQSVMGENPSHFSRFGGGRNGVKDISDEELKLFPVESVSWNDVQEFINKLNEQEKKRGSGYLYRLPMEAEWEYACRGGSTSEAECSFHFYFDKPTNDLSSEQANFNGNYPDGNAPKGKYLQRTMRVGAYPPNKLGLCDMHGNVEQWCSDSLDEGVARPLRGGGWYGDGQYCKAAFRRTRAPSSRFNSVGFRIARVPSGSK